MIECAQPTCETMAAIASFGDSCERGVMPSNSAMLVTPNDLKRCAECEIETDFCLDSIDTKIIPDIARLRARLLFYHFRRHVMLIRNDENASMNAKERKKERKINKIKNSKRTGVPARVETAKYKHRYNGTSIAIWRHNSDKTPRTGVGDALGETEIGQHRSAVFVQQHLLSVDTDCERL